jgi:hypothetical protein
MALGSSVISMSTPPWMWDARVGGYAEFTFAQGGRDGFVKTRRQFRRLVLSHDARVMLTAEPQKVRSRASRQKHTCKHTPYAPLAYFDSRNEAVPRGLDSEFGR